MRLTLRTLLAYLDDILEDGDIQTLKAKIEESGLATQLIARIRNSVDHREIGALSPDAIGPLENANVMGEYLDSTLSPEQIAEIERLCLESDTSLAEAAACHQILTVVLGEPAQVQDALRQRIYDLPLSDELTAMEKQTQPAADTSVSGKAPIGAESIASLDMGEPAGGLESAGYELASSDSDEPTAPVGGQTDGQGDFASIKVDATTSVRPVGPDDSGVSQAASRIRSDTDEFEGQSEAEIVARTTRELSGHSDVYGGAIRPSRITPWLVTLALAGVMLYVLGQIFAPLSRRGVRKVGSVAMEDIDNGAGQVFEPVPELAPTPPTDTDEAAEPEMDSTATDDSATDDSKAVDSTANPTDAPTAIEAANAESSMGDSESNAIEPVKPENEKSINIDETRPGLPEETASEATNRTGSDGASATKNTVVMEPKPNAEALGPDSEPNEAAQVETINDPGMIDPLTDSTASEKQPDSKIGTKVVAKLGRTGSLVLVQGFDGWSRLVDQQPVDQQPDATDPNKVTVAATTKVLSGQTIIAPAMYRPILANEDGLEWVLAGPTRMRVMQDESDTAESAMSSTELIDGRALIASSQPSVKTRLQLGPRIVTISMAEAQTELAIEVMHIRPPGFDPLVPENRQPIYRIIATQNGVTLESQLTRADGETVVEKAIDLQTGQQWQGRGEQPTAITTVDRLPEWVDDAAKKNLPIESARKGLLDFIDPTQPIEKSLREAMAFRRIEVAALAAETLLLLDRADVYFGSDGILSRPRQRLYWTEHFQMLRQHIASDAKAAASVQTAIARAELADSANLFRLLVGFSQEELANGGDEKLVAFLDSASMPVRVLAIENLKAIVGDDLGYRADQENANSRRSDIKKWDVRLRKGDIRYKP